MSQNRFVSDEEGYVPVTPSENDPYVYQVKVEEA
jgi:hypothetical protein